MKRRELAQTRDQLIDPIESLAGLAVLAGDYKLAKQAKSLAVVTGASFDLVQLYGSFRDQPFKVVNLYLLIGTTALDLFKGSKGDPQFAAIMEALRGLSTQIEEFRQEMHARFDKLELLQAHYFTQAFLDFDQIESSQSSLRRAVENLQSDLKDLKVTVTMGFDAMAQDRLRALNALCLGRDVGGAKAVGTYKEANYCFSGYLAYASGAQANLIEPDARQLNVLDWASLSKAISQSTGMPPIPPYDLNHFVDGAELFAKMMKQNPKFASLGRTSVYPDARTNYSLPALIAQGHSLERFYRGMALEPRGSGFGLRTDLFDKLLSDYYRRITEITSAARAAYPGVLRDWPDPARASEQVPPEAAATSSTLVGRQIELCTPDKKISKKSEWFHGRDFDGNPYPKITEFNPAGVTTNAQFVRFLPPIVRWGDYFGALDRNVPKPAASFVLSACFNKVSMDLVDVYRPKKSGSDAQRSHVHATLGLDIIATYQLHDGRKKRLVVTHIDANPKEDLAWFFDPLTGPGLLNMMWTGASAMDTNEGVRRSIMGRGIAAAPGDFFHVNNDDAVKANIAEVEKDLGEVFNTRKPELLRTSLATAGVDARRVDTLRAQILYLVREGIDLGDPAAQEFYEGLVNTLPTAEGYLRWAVDVSMDKAPDKFAAAFKKIPEAVMTIDRKAELRPAPSRLGPSIERLEAIAAAKDPSPFWGWWGAPLP